MGSRIPGVPVWLGEPIDGRLAIDSTRDGYGDALMALRFAAEARRRAGGMLLLCRPEEARLLGRSGGIDREATDPAALPIVATRSTVLGLTAALG